MTIPGYDYTRPDFAELLLRKFYPERTDRESGVIRDYLLQHIDEYDQISFSVRIGQGLTPDPSHLEGIQRNTARFTRKRIDVVGYAGTQATLIEAKDRVTPAVLGQLQSDRHLWLEEHHGEPDPALIAIGRSSDPDTLRVLNAAGVTVYLYPLTQG